MEASEHSKFRIIMGPQDKTKRARAKAFRREMTSTEVMLWERLRRNQLNGLHFRRQQVIDGFITDFYYHSAGLIIEVDGGVHDEQPEYDQERSHVFSLRQLRVLRFDNEQVINNIEAVLQKIAATVQL